MRLFRARITKNMSAEISTETAPRKSCKKCMLYISDECFGDEDPEECQHYKPSMEVDEEERKRWEKLISDVEVFRRGWHRY